MKKFILLCLLPLLSHAQIALTKPDGIPIVNGQVFTYNSTEESAATLYYKIKNTSTNGIKLRIKITNLQNTTGSGFQFCYLNVCLPSVSLNAVYPNNSNPPIFIAGNSETPAIGYNMWNSNSGTGTFPMEIGVRYYLVDDADNEYGTPFTVIYRYDPTALATHEITKNQNSFAEISDTVIKDNIKVAAKENASYNLFTTDGRSVMKGKIDKGDNQIDVLNLANGIYILNLENNKGKIFVKKIIKH